LDDLQFLVLCTSLTQVRVRVIRIKCIDTSWRIKRMGNAGSKQSSVVLVRSAAALAATSKSASMPQVRTIASVLQLVADIPNIIGYSDLCKLGANGLWYPSLDPMSYLVWQLE
jgi:hypothetical protein